MTIHSDPRFIVPKAVLLAGLAVAMFGIYRGSVELASKGFIMLLVSVLLWVAENELRYPLEVRQSG